jgi:predicted DNA-binding transcriptional regulator AlpA
MATSATTASRKNHKTEQPSELGRMLIDRRAHRLVKLDFHDEESLSTKEVAAWLGVSVQFLEIARGKGEGHGPKFKVLSPKVVRYRVGDVKAWLESRTHASTQEYIKRQGA